MLRPTGRAGEQNRRRRAVQARNPLPRPAPDPRLPIVFQCCQPAGLPFLPSLLGFCCSPRAGRLQWPAAGRARPLGENFLPAPRPSAGRLAGRPPNFDKAFPCIHRELPIAGRAPREGGGRRLDGGGSNQRAFEFAGMLSERSTNPLLQLNFSITCCRKATNRSALQRNAGVSLISIFCVVFLV